MTESKPIHRTVAPPSGTIWPAMHSRGVPSGPTNRHTGPSASIARTRPRPPGAAAGVPRVAGRSVGAAARRRRNRGGVARSGSVLVLVLAALIVVSLLLAAIGRTVFLSHQWLRDEERRAQADWYAESALNHARNQLRHDRSYPGGPWQPPAAPTADDLPLSVATHVEPVPGAPDHRIVRVEVREADTRRQRVLLLRERLIPHAALGATP